MPEKGATAITIIFVTWVVCFIGLLILVVDEELPNYVSAYDQLITEKIVVFGQPLVVLLTVVGLITFSLWIGSKADD